MQYEVAGPDPLPNAESLEKLLHAIDPAAMVDDDPRTGGLRVSSAIGAAELARTLENGGFPTLYFNIRQLPSDCCGGCGG